MPHCMEEVIRRTPWFRRHARAYEVESGLPLRLVSATNLEKLAGRWEMLSPFCAALHARIGTPGSCRRPLLGAIRHAAGQAPDEPVGLCCPAGLALYAAPIGRATPDGLWLVTGGVLEKRGDGDDVGRVRRRLTALLEGRPGARGDAVDKLMRLLHVMPAAHLHAHVRMMSLFGALLGIRVDGFMQCLRTWESPSIRKAKSLIESGHGDTLRRNEIARACGMSPSHFSRTFHRQTGFRFRTYVNLARLDEWKKLLADPGVTISEAAFRAGFQSISQANRVFRADTGCSPNAWRHRLDAPSKVRMERPLGRPRS
jgi:AraC-like DNA-binding protein